MDQDRQPDHTQPVEQPGEHQRRVLAALRSARQAHQRAIGLHEQAAALFASLGDQTRAELARQAADRERERLRQADHKLAELAAADQGGQPPPGQVELGAHAQG
jgi:hypothetical protein